MKKYIKQYTSIGLVALVVVACTGDFEKVNENPNLPKEVSAPSLLRSITFDPMNANLNMQLKFIGQVMQYWVYTNENAFDLYNFSGDAGIMDAVWKDTYLALRNSKTMVDVADGDKGYQAAGKILDAFHLAILTEVWGDVPYTEALKADDDVLNPKYDSQESIFKVVLKNLEDANTLLSGDDGAFGAGGDALFGGDKMLWRKMANSLRLRYLLRVSNSGKYPNAQAEFEAIVSDSGKYPIITSNAEQSTYNITGLSPNTTDFANTTTLAGITISERFVDKLGNGTVKNYTDDDPRLGFFVRLKADLTDSERAKANATLVDSEKSQKDKDAAQKQLDNERIAREGGKVGDKDIEGGYLGTPNGANTAVGKATDLELNAAKLRPMFQDNKGLLDFTYISYSQVEFILAEAKLKGWGVAGTVESHFNAGITANFAYWGVTMPADFLTRTEVTLEGIGTSTEDQLERIMEQKWMAGFMINNFDIWADYKRTGKANYTIGVQARSNSADIPNRMLYPRLEQTVNSANYNVATGGNETITKKHWYQD